MSSACSAALFCAARLQVVGVELRRDVRVGRRIVQLGVDPVEDAEQPVAAIAQDRVEPLAELGRQDLPGVRLADRVDDVGEQEAARHQVDDVVEIGRDVGMGDEAGLGQARDLEHPVAEDALVLQVVRGVERRDVPEERVGLVDGLEPVRDQRGVPLVAVDHVGLPVERAAGLERGPREEDEALGVVRVHVDALAVEVALAVHEETGVSPEPVPIVAS